MQIEHKEGAVEKILDAEKIRWNAALSDILTALDASSEEK